MAGTGINRDAGTILPGFEHVEQSIGVILTTPIGSRVMRREFGSELFDLIDRPLTDQVILAIYAAAVMAIARWEPRYVLTNCKLAAVDEAGTVSLEFSGVYYPRGHLGDYSVSQERSGSFIFSKGR